MGYSEDEFMVRVDFFKESGKWYATEAVVWNGGWSKDVLIYDAFKKSLLNHFKNNKRFSDLDAVCLEPYHELAHPLCFRNGGWNR